MGNVAPCIAGGPVVKVMLPDATIEKYDHPVQVAEVVAMYPNYAVVHCSAAKPAFGHLRAVIIMRMDEILLPGQAYILYPVPKSLNDSLRSSDGIEAVSSSPDVSGELKTKMGSGRLGSGRHEEDARDGAITAELTAEELEWNLRRTLMGPAISRKVASEAVCAVDSKTIESTVGKTPSDALSPRLVMDGKKMDGKKEKREKAESVLQPCGWTPELYQISED